VNLKKINISGLQNHQRYWQLYHRLSQYPHLNREFINTQMWNGIGPVFNKSEFDNFRDCYFETVAACILLIQLVVGNIKLVPPFTSLTENQITKWSPQKFDTAIFYDETWICWNSCLQPVIFLIKEVKQFYLFPIFWWTSSLFSVFFGRWFISNSTLFHHSHNMDIFCLVVFSGLNNWWRRWELNPLPWFLSFS
jgi:hypothetical protein